MTQKKKTGISRLLEFGGRYRWMTVVACILSGLSSVLMLCPFLCIWLVLRDVLAALPDLSEVDVGTDVYKRQLPHKLAVIVNDLDFSIITANLTVIALCVKLCIHNVLSLIHI